MARTVGVEEEFLLVRGPSAELTAEGEVVVSDATSASDGQFEKELKRTQAELGTSPHASIDNLGEDLRRRRRELARAAARHGTRLLATATSPLQEEASTTADERYERMDDRFGRVARMQVTCGMHVHVSVESPSEGVGVIDRIRPWLPTLVALSGNSPLYGGLDTDYASYRTVLWGQWPTAGSPDLFHDLEGYERARNAMVSSGAAMDDGMVYFDARLSANYPTVEIRVADVCARLDDAVVIASLVRAMVTTAADSWANDQPAATARSELLRAASWRAARWGITGDLVDVSTATPVPAWDLIGGLVDWVGPALKQVGDLGLVETGLAEIRRRGTGATLQRDAFAAGGVPGSVDAVVVEA